MTRNWKSLAETNWDLLVDGPVQVDKKTIQTACLIGIYRELCTLNRLLGCKNFIQIPATLRAIRKNTEKPKAKAKPKAGAGRRKAAGKT
jgi:hypothetical protein